MDWRAGETAYEDHVTAARTLPELWTGQFERHADRPAQRYKGGREARSLVPDPIPEVPAGTYGTLSYGTLGDVVGGLARGFRAVGTDPGDRVAIFAPTRMEWTQTDLAITCGGGVVTTVYDNATPELVAHQVGEAGVTGVVVGGADELERLRAVEDDLELSFIASMDEVADPDCYGLGALYRRGQEADGDWIADVEPEDVATVVYTSGTTGKPSGIALTHRNLCANVGQIRRRFAPRPDTPSDLPRIDDETVTLSFLPLAHILERTAGQYTVLAAGGSIAYAESVETVRDDLRSVRPTAIVGVPRVYERFDEAIREQAEDSPGGSRLLEWAVNVGTRHRRTDEPGATLRVQRRLADRLVGRRVRRALGGRIELLVCGGGRLDPVLCARYHALGLPLIEGYGLTETAPVVTVNPVEAPVVGSIGPPVDGVDVSIDEDAVDVGGEAGELLVRGPNVAAASWTDEEPITDADGWLHTGDVVRGLEDGYLAFVERTDELLVLSTGHKVMPRPIEAACRADELVRDCLVLGNDEKFVSALIAPVGSVAVDRGLVDTPAAAAGSPVVRAAVADAIDGVNGELEPDQRIKSFRLVDEPFTVDNGLRTPTLKKKRAAVEDRFATEVAAMYRE